MEILLREVINGGKIGDLRNKNHMPPFGLLLLSFSKRPISKASMSKSQIDKKLFPPLLSSSLTLMYSLLSPSLCSLFHLFL
jgi:hypothetical protein